MSKTPIISCGHIENKLMYPHRNPGMELVLVEQGGLEWAVEGVPEVLKPGMVFFTLPWQAHGSMHIREPRNRIYFVLFELMEAYSQRPDGIAFPEVLGFSPEEQRPLSRAFMQASCHAWPGSALLRGLFPEMIQRLETGAKQDAVVALSLLRTLIAELARIIRAAPAVESAFSPAAVKVRRFFAGISHQLDQPWTLDSMAQACGIKRTHFANITRRFSGYPPMQYLNRMRFEKACTLLRDTRLPITEIAFECGYSSSQYFTETFKKYARMAPSAYRASLPELEKMLEVNWLHPEIRSVSDERHRIRTMKSE